MKSDLSVTLVQADLVWENIEANLAMFDAAIDGIGQPTDLMVLPEMFSTGFSMNAPALAEPMDGQAVSWLRRKAAARGAAITGSLMIADQGRFYNRLVWAAPDGTCLVYDKKHLFAYAGEDKVYSAGERQLTTTLRGWLIRPFICYDLRFPIWTRNLNLDYDLALFVANWPAQRAAHWQALLRARAIENQAYVVGVNRVGRDGLGHDFSGDSAVIGPAGQVLFEQARQTCLHTERLSLKALEEYRTAFPAWRDADLDLGLTCS